MLQVTRDGVQMHAGRKEVLMFGPSPEPGSLEVHHGRGSREVVLFGPSTIAPLGVYPLGRSPSNGDASSEHGAGVDGPHSFVFDGRRSRGVQTAGGGSDGEEYLEGYKPLAFDRSRLRGGHCVQARPDCRVSLPMEVRRFPRCLKAKTAPTTSTRTAV